MFYDALQLAVEIYEISKKAGICLSKLLSMKLFAPLFTTLLAVNSRILSCFEVLMLEYDFHFESLRQAIKVPNFIVIFSNLL